MSQPPIGDKLAEEIRTAQIDRNNFVEAFLGRLGDVCPDLRGDPRVVDQSVDTSEFAEHRVDHGRALGSRGELRGDRKKSLRLVRRRIATKLRGLIGRRTVARVVNGHIVALFGQRKRHPAAQTAACARDENNRS